MRRLAVLVLLLELEGCASGGQPDVWSTLTPAQRVMNCANGGRADAAWRTGLRVSPDGNVWLTPDEYGRMLAAHCRA